MLVTTYLPGRGESAEQFTADRCREIVLKAIGESIDVEIIEAAPWQPYERVADQFGCGRVFLAGDSAHAMPPFNAGGANCALASAHNLAWKLAAVLTGSAGPDLLDTYQAERRPVGRFSARQSLTGPALRLLRRDGHGPELPPDEEAPMFALLIGHQYHSTAVVSDDPDPVDPDPVSLVTELRAQPGTRLPHMWLQHGEKRISTLDLLGPGFTVLTGRDGGAWRAAVSHASEVLGIPLAVHRIVDEQWAPTTGLAADGALLIRPDDFVGWRSESLPADPEIELQRALATILARI